MIHPNPHLPYESKSAKLDKSFLSIFPQMPSEIYFFKYFLIKFCKNVFYQSAVSCCYAYIFKNSNYIFPGVLFWIYFKNSYFDTSINNYLLIEFWKFFLYWFYMFSLYNFNFQRLIWKTISVYFLWFDY